MADISNWSDIEFRLYESVAENNASLYTDRWAQTLYDFALFDHDVTQFDRSAALAALRDYMWDTYGLDFDQEFDWDGFREAYDTAQV